MAGARALVSTCNLKTVMEIIEALLDRVSPAAWQIYSPNELSN